MRIGLQRAGQGARGAVEPLPQPVTLETAKANPGLAKMALVANSRLSVQQGRTKKGESFGSRGA